MRAFLFAFLALTTPICAAPVLPNPRAADSQNDALLAFKRKQSALWENETALLTPRGEYLKTARALRNQISFIQNFRGDAAAQSSYYPDWPRFQERAYFAANDDSPQPFWIFLPANYSPDKKWPLALFLHGYSTSVSFINPWIPPAEILQYATKKGLILAVPYGRLNSDFVQWGQDDVMRVKSEAQKLFSIDENRVSLCGISMGGYGAYATGLHTMGDWAGVAPISGRTDFYRWFKIQRADLPTWKRALYDADDPRTLAPNALNTPFLIQHGALDTLVDVAHSRSYAADARALGLPFLYLENPSAGHYSDFQFEALERAFDWMITQKRDTAPAKIALVAADLREARNSWARIEAFQNYGELARLDADIEDGTLKVETKNVAKWILEPPTELNAQKLEINGENVQWTDFSRVEWQSDDAKTEKSPEHCGPFKNLMRDPFLLVYGDNSDRSAAARMAGEWRDWTNGDATLKAAHQISEADKANFNLILFGTRASNSLLAQIGDDLPMELTAPGYRIGDRQIKAKNLGLRMVWKSPWSEKRLIGVCSGAWWGQKLPLNHKWDLIPDYIVYDGKFESDDTNRALEAGFFDGNFGLVEP